MNLVGMKGILQAFSNHLFCNVNKFVLLAGPSILKERLIDGTSGSPLLVRFGSNLSFSMLASVPLNSHSVVQ